MRQSRDTPSMGGTEWLLLLALSGLWGGSFFFYKILAAVLPPFTIVFGRVAIAAATLNLILAMRGESMPRSRRVWADFTILGLLNNVIPFSLIVFGETRIPSGLAAILNATTPMFAVAVAHVTANERLTTSRLVGLATGFLGVVVLVGADLGKANDGGTLGEVAVVLASMSYGCAGVFGRRFKALPPLQVAAGQVTASALMALPLALVVDRPWALPFPAAATWGALMGLGIPSTALAYTLFFRILAVAGATNVVLVTLLVPVSALLLGAAFLHEPVTASALAGMTLIGLGLGFVDGRLLSRCESCGRHDAATLFSRAACP